MRKRNICILFIVFVTGLIFSLHSCRLEESYKDFVIENFSNYGIEGYFNSDELDFARVNNVVIVPEIKEVDWGKYVIYISAHSETGKEQITVEKISLEKGENIVFSQKIDENIIFQEISDNLFDGWINGGYFTENDLKFENGKNLYLTVQILVADDIQKTTEEISYQITMIQYMSFAAST